MGPSSLLFVINVQNCSRVLRDVNGHCLIRICAHYELRRTINMVIFTGT